MTNRAQSILPVILYVEDSEEAFIAVEYFLKKYYEVIGAKNSRYCNKSAFCQ